MEASFRPPYASYRSVNLAINIIKKVSSQTIINAVFLRGKNISGSGNEYQVLDALKFLSLIDGDYRITTKGVSFQIKKDLETIVKEAYRPVFRRFRDKRITKENILAYFTIELNLTPEIARKARTLFVRLGEKVGIKIERAVKPIHVKGREGKIPDITIVIALTPETAKMSSGDIRLSIRKIIKACKDIQEGGE